MKRYELIITETKGDKDMRLEVNIKRVNNGFNAMELLGYLELIRSEILQIIQGNEDLKVFKITREVGPEIEEANK